MADDPEVLQGELFSRFSGSGKQRSVRQRFKLRTLGKISIVMPYENLVFLTIIFIMTLVLSFSLGVEHGKGWTARADSTMGEPEILVEIPESTQEPAPPQQKEGPQQKEVPSKPVSAPAKAPTPDRGYTIQLITFNSKDSAQEELDELKENGYEPFLNARGDYFEICVGQYPDTKSAKPLLAKFRESKSYHDAFLKNLR